ncbi:MAG: biopolymer transporter ExbD [Gammaproteobacteria bacterium]|nr:biopolymer transporter ExbD [Gammaproteobacteria bacterium]
MNFRSKNVEEPDLNITPLIDIVFLLLIFFMVSTTFKQEFEVSIELPKASTDAKLVEKVLNIGIDEKGQFFINQQKVINTQASHLRRALEKVAGNDRQLPVIISADAATPHQAVITAMDVARQLGFTKLTFATQQLSNE